MIGEVKGVIEEGEVDADGGGRAEGGVGRLLGGQWGDGLLRLF